MAADMKSTIPIGVEVEIVPFDKDGNPIVSGGNPRGTFWERRRHEWFWWKRNTFKNPIHTQGLLQLLVFWSRNRRTHRFWQLIRELAIERRGLRRRIREMRRELLKELRARRAQRR